MSAVLTLILVPPLMVILVAPLEQRRRRLREETGVDVDIDGTRDQARMEKS